MDVSLIDRLIKAHEGLRLKPYQDTTGHLTVGYGFNLDAPGARRTCQIVGVDYDAVCARVRPLTMNEAEALYEEHRDNVINCARLMFPDLDLLPNGFSAVICDMIYNLGYAGFLEFHHFIAAVRSLSVTAAVYSLRQSAWARQVPSRVQNDVLLLEGAA